MGFNDRVYSLAKQIPEGKVSTYGYIAKALNTKAFRAVGNAMHNNPYAPVVPCHRVVESTGKIGGFASGVMNKIKMLEKEGIKVKNSKIVNFDKVLFKDFKKL